MRERPAPAPGNPASRGTTTPRHNGGRTTASFPCRGKTMGFALSLSHSSTGRCCRTDGQEAQGICSPFVRRAMLFVVAPAPSLSPTINDSKHLPIRNSLNRNHAIIGARRCDGGVAATRLSFCRFNALPSWRILRLAPPHAIAPRCLPVPPPPDAISRRA